MWACPWEVLEALGEEVTLSQAARALWPLEYDGQEGGRNSARAILTGCGWREDPDTGLWRRFPVLLWYDNGTGFFDCAGRYPSLADARRAAMGGWKARQLVTPTGVTYVVPGDDSVIWDNAEIY